MGVAPPASWHLEYRSGNAWVPIPRASDYTTTMGSFNEVTFDPITTRCLRAVFDASGDGQQYPAVAVQEWETLGLKPLSPSSTQKTFAVSNPQSGCSTPPTNP